MNAFKVGLVWFFVIIFSFCSKNVCGCEHEGGIFSHKKGIESACGIDFLTPSSDLFEVGKVLGQSYYRLVKLADTEFANVILALIDFKIMQRVLNEDVMAQRWVYDATSAALRKELSDVRYHDFSNKKKEWRKQDECEGFKKDINEMLIDLEALAMVHDLMIGLEKFKKVGKSKGIVGEVSCGEEKYKFDLAYHCPNCSMYFFYRSKK